MNKNRLNPEQRSRSSGFTLIETMVVLGIAMILIAIVLPALSGARDRAKRLQALSINRQLALLVVQYAGENDDRVPAIFPPERHDPYRPPDCWTTVEVGGREFTGTWWSNWIDGFYALAPPPVPSAMRAPGAPGVEPILVHGDPTSHYTDYTIAQCFYATPNYWQRGRQVGPAQWKAQAISDVRYPSQKGLLIQDWMYSPLGRYSVDNGREEASYLSIRYGERTSIVWSDLSGSHEDIWSLPIGVPNTLRCEGSANRDWDQANGIPIHNTLNGIAGLDR